MRIIGFEIVYSDFRGEFEMSMVYEDEDPPEKSCSVIYVPLKRNAWQVNWEFDDGAMECIGIEFEPCGTCEMCKECGEHEKRSNILLKSSV